MRREGNGGPKRSPGIMDESLTFPVPRAAHLGRPVKHASRGEVKNLSDVLSKINQRTYNVLLI